MKITFLEADQEIDILSLLKQKSIHYVSIAKQVNRINYTLPSRETIV